MLSKNQTLTYTMLQDHASILGIQIPFAEIELKKAFRKESFRWHPDREGGDAQQMTKVNKAYEILSSHEAITYGVYKNTEGEANMAIMQTIDGRFLADLGLGLGPTQNGRDCPQCHHKGYTVFHYSREIKCPSCLGSGSALELVNCMACKGKGTLRTIDERTIDCGPCVGTGKVQHKTRMARCIPCRALGYVMTAAGQPSYSECWQCKGTGEIAILNPVIAKGRLQNLKVG